MNVSSTLTTYPETLQVCAKQPACVLVQSHGTDCRKINLVIPVSGSGPITATLSAIELEAAIKNATNWR